MNWKDLLCCRVTRSMTKTYTLFLDIGIKSATAILLFFVLLLATMPAPAAAADDLEVAGWIPYWRDSEGIKDAKKHLDDIDTLHPFSYGVKQNGTLSDLADMDAREWVRFKRSAEREGVEIIPTVMWSDGAHIHRILSDRDLREEHIEAIVDMVDDGDYDGVDIDYEAKRAETINYFSQFLKELKDELGSKILTCTIEARTPPESLYKRVPETIQYANDYKAIAAYCDRVEIMAYDQQRADLKLNEAKAGEPYMPVSDVDWVRKVIAYTTETIPAEKIMLGVATYGHHYEVTVSPNWYQGYRRIGALNMPDMLDVADEYDVDPGRNKAGEMSFTYFPESSVYKLLRALPVPDNTRKGMEAAAQALLFANYTGETLTFNLGWYSDAEAINDKIELAKEFNLRGVALFKIDGEEDDRVWKYLQD